MGNSKGGHRASQKLSSETLLVRSDKAGDTVLFYEVNERGNITRLVRSTPNYDPRTRPWYKIGEQAGKPKWNFIYPHIATKDLLMAHSLPIYNKDKKLLGVTFASITLLEIDRFLNSIKIGKSGKLFIVERSGLLVATSTPEKPFTISNDGKEQKRLKASDSNDNAIKFTDEGGVSLKVAAINPPQQPTSQPLTLHFEIEDSGAGVAAEELDKLFEAFAQTQTGKTAQEGTGLGLPISRKFVQLMGGDMTVSSQVGYGTTVKFDIQAIAVEAADEESGRSKQQVTKLEPNQPQYRILVVDDKDINRQILQKLLVPVGFEVKEASNGQEAIDLWQQWQPDLIWMDMRMPVLNGIEATQYIKAQANGNSTKIIALTASCLEEERAAILAVGCDDFMRKPFRDCEIFDIMAKHIGVKYIYEELNNGQNQPHRESAIVELQPSDFKIMPAEWLAEFHAAAIAGRDEQLTALIEQIPDQQSAIVKTLNELVDNFEFDTLIELTEHF